MHALTRLTTMTAFLGLGFHAAVHAQELRYNPSVYVMPQGTFANPDNQFGTKATGGGGGLKVGKALNRWFDVQAGVDYARASGGDTRIQQATAGVDGLFFLTRDRVRPFALVGIGAENDHRNQPNRADKHTSPYAAAGAGVQIVLADRWAAQLDYKRLYTFQRSGAFAPDRRTQSNFVNLGVTYFFDKTPTARVAQAAPPPPAPSAPPPAPPSAPPAPRFEKQTFAATELFTFDSATVRRPQPKLDQIADVLRDNPDVTNVRVTGYTDRLGGDAYNQRLSQRRADAVKAYLVAKGVAGSRLTAMGRGKADPIAQCDERRRAALIRCLEPNRRVDVEDVTVRRRVD